MIIDAHAHPDRILGYAAFASACFGRAILDEIDRCVSDYGMCGLQIYSTADPRWERCPAFWPGQCGTGPMTMWPLLFPTGAIDALAYTGNWPHWPVPGSDETALLKRMDRLGTGQMPECNLVKLVTGALDDQTRDAILNTNATRFFNLAHS